MISGVLWLKLVVETRCDDDVRIARCKASAIRETYSDAGSGRSQGAQSPKAP